jgi:Family of unknown function (DUF6445)
MSHHPRLTVLKHGAEQQPIIVIDNFIAEPEHLREDASMLGFKPIGPHYPGVRAQVPSALVGRFIKDVSEIVCQVFNLANPLEIIESYYSLVTTPPHALAPIQRLPHFDSVEPNRIALLHYITPNCQGGTAFFRHQTTGYETINQARLKDYSTVLEQDIKTHGVPSAAYIAGDTKIYERVAHYEAQFNRAIIYRSNTLHCADIPPTMELSAQPLLGRLTVNTFLRGSLSV